MWRDRFAFPLRERTGHAVDELQREEARVAVVPGEAFGAPGYMRLSYALSDEDLEEGLNRIAKLARVDLAGYDDVPNVRELHDRLAAA